MQKYIKPTIQVVTSEWNLMSRSNGKDECPPGWHPCHGDHYCTHKHWWHHCNHSVDSSKAIEDYDEI